MFKTLFEDPIAEAMRLGEAPVGSVDHSLAMLRVNITHDLKDVVIELPQLWCDEENPYSMTVIPIKRNPNPQDGPRTYPAKLNDGSWDCLVIASSHPFYPAGRRRITLSEAHLVRGALRAIEMVKVA